MKKQIVYYTIIALGIVSIAWCFYSQISLSNIDPKQNAKVTQQKEILAKKIIRSTATTTQSTIVPILSDFSDIQIDTSDWQTYKSEKYGYEFKYPKGWYVREAITNSGSTSLEGRTFISKSIPPPESFREAVGFVIQFLGEKKSANDLLKETIKLSESYFSISQLEYKTETTGNDTELVLLKAYEKNRALSFHVYITRNNKMFRVIYETPGTPPIGGYESPSTLYGIARTFSLE